DYYCDSWDNSGAGLF
nr:immunoglobulin light chain junction region [Macaca mulatta]